MDEQPPAAQTDKPPTTRRVSPKAIAAVAAAVLGGIVLAVVLRNLPRAETGDAGESAVPSVSDAATESVAPTASAEPSETPTATPDPTQTPRPEGAAPMSWTAGTPPDGLVNDIVRIANGWLAVGSITEAGTRARAATWTSEDGATWTPGARIGPDPVPGPEGMSYFMQDVLVLADEIIVFGWNHIGCCDGGKAALWRSTDGVNWTYVDATGTDYDTYHFPVDAAVAPTGELVLLSGIGLGTGSTFFTSTDGANWVEQPIDAEETAFGAVAGSDETLLAVGHRPFTSEPNPVVWASADARSWTAVSPPPGANELLDVAWDAVGGRFVIVGTDVSGRPTAWLTANGASWATTTLADEGGSVASVTASDGLIIAAGFVGNSVDDLIAWSSFDGVTWQVQPLETPVGAEPIVTTAGERAVLHVSGQGPEPDYEPVARTWAGSSAR